MFQVLSWYRKTILDMAPAAFGREHLLGERWLLGSNAHGVEAIWADIGSITPKKQELFVERILFLHTLAISRATSASQAVRLPLTQWDKEIEIAALGSYVLEAMLFHRDKDQNNARVFSDDVLKECRTRFIEGYHVTYSATVSNRTIYLPSLGNNFC